MKIDRWQHWQKGSGDSFYWLCSAESGQQRDGEDANSWNLPSRSSGKHPNLTGSVSFIVFVMLSCKNGIGMILNSAGVSSFLETAFCTKTNCCWSHNTQIYCFKERRSAGTLKTGSRLIGWTRAPSHVLKKRPAKVSFAFIRSFVEYRFCPLCPSSTSRFITNQNLYLLIFHQKSKNKTMPLDHSGAIRRKSKQSDF